MPSSPPTQPFGDALLDDYIEFCNQSCLIIFRELGLSQSLTYLLAFLSQYYPITRIFCGFRHYRHALFIPVADTLPSGVRTTQSMVARALTPAQMRKILVRDDFSPYILTEDPRPEGPHGVLRPEDFISHLRIPMFKLGEMTFQMGFCSSTPDVFTAREVKRFQSMTRLLSAAMEKNLLISMNSGDIPKLYKDNAALLRMCSGLFPLLEALDKVADTDCTVLIEGETGVGKDMVADTLHRASCRRNGPFIKINCGAVSESILESELFGHEKGAFTGATTSRIGYFEAANGGTIFLDEVGELTPRIQAELLRTLDNREILRVGSTRSIPLDIRILAATNRDLRSMVDDGTFRADLWYRISTFPLHVPPLRHRKMDIPILTRIFADSIATRLGLSSPPALPIEQMEKLYRHDWPGNIRELRNVIERAIILAKNGNTSLPLHFDIAESSAPPLPFPPTQNPPFSDLPNLETMTTNYINYVLQRTEGKISGPKGAATILDIHPNTVRERRQTGKYTDNTIKYKDNITRSKIGGRCPPNPLPKG